MLFLPVFIPLMPVFILGRKPVLRFFGFPRMVLGNDTKENTVTSVYSFQLKHDQSGRIVEKTEVVKRKPLKWAYDKKGRLYEAKLDNRLICQCQYDKQGRHAQDDFPTTHGSQLRNSIATKWTLPCNRPERTTTPEIFNTDQVFKVYQLQVHKDSQRCWHTHFSGCSWPKDGYQSSNPEPHSGLEPKGGVTRKTIHLKFTAQWAEEPRPPLPIRRVRVAWGKKK